MWPNPQFPAVWSHLLKNSLMENIIFCAVLFYVILSCEVLILVDLALCQTYFSLLR